jgi:hypothetical protein
VPSVAVDAKIADVRALGQQEFPVPVTSADGILLGALQPSAASLSADTPVERAMVPAPGTIRPELRVEEVTDQLSRDHLDHVFVTAVNGVLLGLVIAEDLHV